MLKLLTTKLIYNELSIVGNIVFMQYKDTWYKKKHGLFV